MQKKLNEESDSDEDLDFYDGVASPDLQKSPRRNEQTFVQAPQTQLLVNEEASDSDFNPMDFSAKKTPKQKARKGRKKATPKEETKEEVKEVPEESDDEEVYDVYKSSVQTRSGLKRIRDAASQLESVKIGDV